MRDRRRPPRAAIVAPAVSALALVIGACGTSDRSVPSTVPTGSLGSAVAGSPTASATGPTPTPALTPVPGGPTPRPSDESPGPISTTDTEWGVILDQLPVGFPVYPGSLEADAIDGPASGAFSVPASGPVTTSWYQAALETAGFSTITLSGPLEDGQVVIDSEGARAGCRVQTTIRPLSGTTHVSILYAAACAG